MNNLVAYDPDSDEESPRRRSMDGSRYTLEKTQKETTSHSQGSADTEERTRRNSDVMYDEDAFSSGGESASNFAEPPPPKRRSDHSPSRSPGFRTPQPSMSQASSQVSLVSYAAEAEEESATGRQHVSERSTPMMSEPKPPERKSQDDDSDEDERLIDLALEESKQALLQMNAEVSPAGSQTPGTGGSGESPRAENESNEQNAGDAEPELAQEDEIQIPPAPVGDVDPALQAKFEAAFRQKAHGVNLNNTIQGRQDFSNPMSYERFIHLFDIDEKGTNFSKKIFDPHGFTENCFYDKIEDNQRRTMEAQEAKKSLGK